MKSVLARFAGFVLAPALLTAASVRLLLPGAVLSDAPSLWRWLSRLAAEQTIVVVTALFVAWSAILRVWLPVSAASTSAKRMTGRTFVVTLVAAAAVALTLRTSVAGSHRVSSGSMLPTLAPADLLLTSKLAFGFRVPLTSLRIGGKLPSRGDVVVFRSTEAGAGEAAGDLVKRVIGLPGDRITMDGGHPIINGWKAPSCVAGSYTHHTPSHYTRGRLEVEFLDGHAYLTVQEIGTPGFSGYVVGPDEVFVVGDNRALSNDSRTWRGGAGAGVRLDDLHGRVSLRLFGETPAGRVDVRSALSRLAPAVRLPSLDVAAVEASVRACLNEPPAVTSPPAESSAS